MAGGEAIEAQDEVYFGLRVVFLPLASDVFMSGLYDAACQDIPEDLGLTYKAFTSRYGNSIPLVAAEKQFTTDSFRAELYNENLQDLVCLLVDTPEYKMLFEHCFPIPK